MRTDIREQCAGKWHSILTHLGIDEKYLNGKHGPCILCQGRDRARWIRESEIYYCSQCDPKSPVDLAMLWLKQDFKQTVRTIRSIMGLEKMETKPKVDKQKENEERLKRIHKGLRRITPDCEVAWYLAKRGIESLPGKDCYFHPGIPYYDNGERTGVFPAMVAAITSAENKLCSYHVTYLTPKGAKLCCSSPKKIMPTIRDIKCGSIKLFEPDNTLNICEGIETALSIYQDSGIATWAAISANGMINIEIPDQIKHVFIYADEDKSGTGVAAAYELSKRLKRTIDVCVVRLFDGTPFYDYGNKDMDFNDYIISTKADK